MGSELRTMFLSFLLVGTCFASSAVDKQLRDHRNALKSLEKELDEQRKQLQAMENEEKGVLNTLSLLDQNLGQTKEYINELERTEKVLGSSVSELQGEVDSLGTDISRQEAAMEKRIRELYVKGRRSQVDQLFRLLKEKENPERSLYRVRRLLRDDQEMVDKLTQSRTARFERQQKLQSRLDELDRLHNRKVKEQTGLKSQINRQESALESLRRDKTAQQAALEEYERNQQMLLTLIKSLEEKRQKEEAERRKRNQAAGRHTQEITAVGPKCVPLKGELLSEFGMHEHAVLHTMTRNLGIEIRAERGAPIKSAAAGTVVAVTRMGGRGPTVIIQHNGDLFTVYGHLKTINVQVGQEVRHCQVIGEAGDAESLNGPKLFFQVNRGVRTVDPVEWLGADQ